MLATILLWTLLLQGCQHFAKPVHLPTTPEDNSARLIARSDFRPAAQAAPEWVKDALRTITRLETEKANHSP